MQIKLKGNYSEFLDGIIILEEEINFSVSQEGIPLNIIANSHAETVIEYKDGAGTIRYGNRYHLFRAFGLFLERLQEGSNFQIVEKPQFQTIGPMFDLSRNAVMRVDRFKGMLRKLALMGFNSAMLYMEDTYEIKGIPYFGYMRGRYTEKELKELDEYAYHLGIELIPCIQTLAHLEEFLKWDAVSHLKDTRGILMVDQETTYEFIEKMITAASKPFRSKRIHIGMDEAEELGRGKYLNKHGYKDRLELMSNHLERVIKIANNQELEVMMWSDMFLKLASNSDDQYNKATKISDEMKSKIPSNVKLMYWDYFHTAKQDYLELIDKHVQLGGVPAFAGGIWVWNTFATNYGLSLKTSEAALQACKERGIQDVFVTLWGDDGYENNFYSAMLGLQLYAEHQYSEVVDQDSWYKRVKFCTGLDAQTFLQLNDLDKIPGVEEGNLKQTNPSKFLLWQDVLLGLFDKHIEGLDIQSHYEALERKIQESRNQKAELDFILEVPEKLSAVLAVKASVGLRLKDAYDKKQHKELLKLAEADLPSIIKRVKALRFAHKKQWLQLNKPFGWEVLDIRYGGLIARLETAVERVTDYAEGKIAQIEELEQERLPYNANVDQSTGLGWSSYYYRIASPNVFFHVLPIY